MGLALYSVYLIIVCIDWFYVVQNCTKVNSRTWHNENEQSHIRASLVGPSLTIPFKENTFLLGTWQQIVIVEMNIRERERKIILQ